MANIWFTSDTHYHHKNIVVSTSDWEDKTTCRNFPSLEEHDTTLVDNINNAVKVDDILYHVGDWSFGGKDKVEEFRKRINCKNIYLVLGNHDHHIRKLMPKYFRDITLRLDRKINGQNMTLHHYPMRSWNKAAEGAWHLYGHHHGNFPDYEHGQFLTYQISPEGFWMDYRFKSMDVGIDTHKEFRPYNFDEIQEIMSTRDNLIIDNHKAE